MEAKTRLVDELFKQGVEKNKKSLTITLCSEDYEKLELVSKASGLSKAKIIKLALEREGIFDDVKLKELKGGKGNVIND